MCITLILILTKYFYSLSPFRRSMCLSFRVHVVFFFIHRFSAFICLFIEILWPFYFLCFTLAHFFSSHSLLFSPRGSSIIRFASIAFRCDVKCLVSIFFFLLSVEWRWEIAWKQKIKNTAIIIIHTKLIVMMTMKRRKKITIV